MSSLDLTSTIGTWVGAGIGILALVGVVGPLLIWRASLTARNQALSRLDAGLASSCDFVTRGVPFGRSTRLYRRVHTPNLIDPPRFKQWKASWGTGIALPHKSSAGWVQLCVALQAYGFKDFSIGDFLVMRKKDEVDFAVLPVSRVWLVILGLIGRFGLRQDGGKWPAKRPTGLLFDQPSGVGELFVERTLQRGAGDNRDSLDLSDDSIEQDPWLVGMRHPRAGKRLDGLVGSLRFGYHSHRVNFRVFPQQDIGGLSPDSLDIAGLFWLSVGCLPFHDGRVFCLDDVQRSADTRAQGHSDFRERSKRHVPDDRWLGSAPGNDPTPEESDDDDFQGRHGNISKAYIGNTMQHNQYVDVPEKNRTSPNSLSGSDVPRRLRFMPSRNRVNERLSGIAQAIGAESENTVTYALTEVLETSATANWTILLKEDVHREFVPSDHPWVRLGRRRLTKGRSRESKRPKFFLMRQDAHLLARVMLSLPMCSQGYLMSECYTSRCIALLVAASRLLKPVLVALIANFNILESHHAFPRGFKDLLSNLLNMISHKSYSRKFANALYVLDCALEGFTNQVTDGILPVQVVLVTSPEFRDLIRQSMDNLEACLPQVIVLDRKEATLDVISVLGTVKKFPLELDVLVDDPQAYRNAGQVDLPYADVLLIVLKASLKSTFIRTSLESEPLFAEALGSKDEFEVI